MPTPTSAAASWTSLRGEEAEQHIQRLHQKYRGGGCYPLGPGERRLKVVIEPVAVKVSG